MRILESVFEGLVVGNCFIMNCHCHNHYVIQRLVFLQVNNNPCIILSKDQHTPSHPPTHTNPFSKIKTIYTIASNLQKKHAKPKNKKNAK